MTLIKHRQISEHELALLERYLPFYLSLRSGSRIPATEDQKKFTLVLQGLRIPSTDHETAFTKWLALKGWSLLPARDAEASSLDLPDHEHLHEDDYEAADWMCDFLDRYASNDDYVASSERYEDWQGNDPQEFGWSEWRQPSRYLPRAKRAKVQHPLAKRVLSKVRQAGCAREFISSLTDYWLAELARLLTVEGLLHDKLLEHLLERVESALRSKDKSISVTSADRNLLELLLLAKIENWQDGRLRYPADWDFKHNDWNTAPD